MLIKICGLRTIEPTLAAAQAGADLLGLVFAPSRRQVSVAEAAPLVAAIRALPAPRPRLVGLFVNASPTTINAIVAELALDLVQLSGDEPLHEGATLNRPIIRSLRMDGSPREAAWLAQSQLGDHPLLFLADAHVPGSYGGTGVQADWNQAAHLATQVPLLLAGGLHAQNVASAIATVQPSGVDVSSGVESAGQKDCAKIRAFIAAAREAASAVSLT
ncbi:phosphoribosylanthranilate isomerase [Candidatus Viridilinea mediisalina]|uniref:N-(5'-phosphoribosyl)anthranilate isomerase n=1 Tax=Candidatus Viridilinea mediisalina TaxID=2024553 RepID=A0A2A6RG46_9CHLR|nr:phosphoribosylanthranilate isomerase [Candidatus Viridilinea mediisalina]PDW01992.1 N-(5'-phosphoribosyl)anthranilate isomerase [Candidatus Viridilinea mediisalina]